MPRLEHTSGRAVGLVLLVAVIVLAVRACRSSEAGAGSGSEVRTDSDAA